MAREANENTWQEGCDNPVGSAASPIALPMPKHTRDSSAEDEAAASPKLSMAVSNHTQPAKVKSHPLPWICSNIICCSKADVSRLI